MLATRVCNTNINNTEGIVTLKKTNTHQVFINEIKKKPPIHINYVGKIDDTSQ